MRRVINIRRAVPAPAPPGYFFFLPKRSIQENDSSSRPLAPLPALTGAVVSSYNVPRALASTITGDSYPLPSHNGSLAPARLAPGRNILYGVILSIIFKGVFLILPSYSMEI